MTITLNEAIKEVTRGAKSGIAVYHFPLEDRQQRLGENALQAAGLLSGRQQEGCTPSGEAVVGWGRKTSRVLLTTLAGKMLESSITPELDANGFIATRTRIAKSLGEVLMELK